MPLSGWSYRFKVTAPASKFSADVSYFVYSYALANAPAEFWTNVSSDGSDIRVTLADGTTEVPFELGADFSTGSSVGSLYFRESGTASSTVDNEYYVYYGNGGASAYAVTDTYGRNNCWQDYQAVFHLDASASGGAPQFINSTGNGYDGTSANGLDSAEQTASTWGTRIQKSGNETIDINDVGTTSPMLTFVDPFTLTLLARPGSATASGIIFSSRLLGGSAGLRHASSRWSAKAYRTENWPTTLTVGETYHVALVQTASSPPDNSTLFFYQDGTELSSGGTANDPINGGHNFTALGGRSGGSVGWNGGFDEVRMRQNAVSAAYISAESQNLLSPSTFWTTGSEENLSAGSVTGTAAVESPGPGSVSGSGVVSLYVTGSGGIESPGPGSVNASGSIYSNITGSLAVQGPGPGSIVASGVVGANVTGTAAVDSPGPGVVAATGSSYSNLTGTAAVESPGPGLVSGSGTCYTPSNITGSATVESPGPGATTAAAVVGQIRETISLLSRIDLQVSLLGKVELTTTMRADMAGEINQNFDLVEGNNKVLSFVCYENGSAKNITGASISWAARSSSSSIVKSVGSGITITNAVAGTFEVSLSQNDTLGEVGSWEHQCDLIDALNQRSTIARGKMTVDKSII